MATPQLVCLMVLALSLGGCIQTTKNLRHAIDPGSKDAVAQTSPAKVLGVSIDLVDEGFRLHISNIPAGSTVSCTLDQQPLSPCSDGGVYGKPAAGDHHVAVTAASGGMVTALGDSPAFTIAAPKI